MSDLIACCTAYMRPRASSSRKTRRATALKGCSPLPAHSNRVVTLLELFLKEGLLLVLLALLGSGVVTLVKGAGVGSRIALAPASGLALGSVVLTTAHFVLRMEIAAFVVLIPMIVVSVAVAVRAARRSTLRPTRRAIAQIAAATLIVATLLSWPLANRDSFG